VAGWSRDERGIPQFFCAEGLVFFAALYRSSSTAARSPFPKGEGRFAAKFVGLTSGPMWASAPTNSEIYNFTPHEKPSPLGKVAFAQQMTKEDAARCRNIRKPNANTQPLTGMTSHAPTRNFGNFYQAKYLPWGEGGAEGDGGGYRKSLQKQGFPSFHVIANHP
jgi:hypothetical protein